MFNKNPFGKRFPDLNVGKVLGPSSYDVVRKVYDSLEMLKAISSNEDIAFLVENFKTVELVAAMADVIVEMGQHLDTIENIPVYVDRAEDAMNLAEAWAIKMDGYVTGTEYSSKYHAMQSKYWADVASQINITWSELKEPIKSLEKYIPEIVSVASNIDDVRVVSADLEPSVILDASSDMGMVGDTDNPVMEITGGNIKKVADNIEPIHITGENIDAVIKVAENIDELPKYQESFEYLEEQASASASSAIDASNEAKVSSQLAKDWAIKEDGLVNDEDYSAKYYANIAKENANKTSSDVESIITTRDEAVQLVKEEGITQVNAVTSLGDSQVQRLDSETTKQITLIESTGESEVQAVNQAGITQISAIAVAGSTQVENVSNEGSTQVLKVQQASADNILQAETTALENLESATESHKNTLQNTSNTEVQKIQNQGSSSILEVQEAQENAITAIITQQNSSIQAVKTQESTSIKAVQDTTPVEIDKITSAGNTQVQLVEAEGTNQLDLISAQINVATQQAHIATTKAEEANQSAITAKNEADRAVEAAEQAVEGQIQVDWNQTDSSQKDFIKNKPNLDLKADKTYVDQQLATKQAVGDYATNSALNQGLEQKLDKTEKAESAKVADSANSVDWENIQNIPTDYGMVGEN